MRLARADQGFDYSCLDLESRIVTERCADGIRSVARQLANNFVEIGHHLNRAKAHLNHGQWGEWLARELGIPDRTAQVYMRAATTFGDADVSMMTLEALDLLAGPSIPIEARAEALELAAAGEPVNKAKAQELRAKYGITVGEIRKVSGTGTALDGEQMLVEEIDGDFIRGSIVGGAQDGAMMPVLAGHLRESAPEPAPAAAKPKPVISESADFWRDRCLEAEALIRDCSGMVSSRELQRRIEEFLG